MIARLSGYQKAAPICNRGGYVIGAVGSAEQRVDDLGEISYDRREIRRRTTAALG